MTLNKNRIDISKIKVGDILMFRTKGLSPISMGIRFLTGSYWNHIGIIGKSWYPTYEPPDFGKFYVIEALGTVQRNYLEKYIDNPNYDLKVIRIKTEAFSGNYEKAVAIAHALCRAQGLIGKKYDYFAIVYLGIKYIVRGILNRIPILRKIPSINTNLLENRYKFFCSELVCSCFHGLSTRYKNIFASKKHPKQTCSTITPGDIDKSKNTYYVTGMKK